MREIYALLALESPFRKKMKNQLKTFCLKPRSVLENLKSLMAFLCLIQIEKLFLESCGGKVSPGQIYICCQALFSKIASPKQNEKSPNLYKTDSFQWPVVN